VVAHRTRPTRGPLHAHGHPRRCNHRRTTRQRPRTRAMHSNHTTCSNRTACRVMAPPVARTRHSAASPVQLPRASIRRPRHAAIEPFAILQVRHFKYGRRYAAGACARGPCCISRRRLATGEALQRVCVPDSRVNHATADVFFRERRPSTDRCADACHRRTCPCPVATSPLPHLAPFRHTRAQHCSSYTALHFNIQKQTSSTGPTPVKAACGRRGDGRAW
jgi:hypothetical protein